MKSTEKHPLAFFDWYFESEIYQDLVMFYKEIEDEQYFNLVDKIDKNKHTIKVQNVHHQELTDSEFIIFSFEGFIRSTIKQEIKQSKGFIELGFEKRFSDKKEVKAYADFLRIKLNTLIDSKASKEFSFLSTYIEQLSSLISQYSKQTINYSFVPSFIILADSQKEQKSRIKTFYNLLIEQPSMINCSIDEFNKAFSGQELEYGIEWLVLAKNKFVSKVSLFYMIDELISKDFISRSILNDLNKYVSYVFRDDKGSQLKNLKQSKSTYSQSVTLKDRIDTIISSL